MLGKENPFGSQFSLFPEVLPPPEERMNPEDSEDGNQEARHQDKGPVEHWLSLWIGMGSMGEELNEVGIGARMAFSTGLNETRVRNKGFRIIPWQDAVETVAVCTTRYQFRIAQMLHLSVVTFVVGLGGDQEDLVSVHHFGVGMALLTNLDLKLLPKFHDLRFLSL